MQWGVKHGISFLSHTSLSGTTIFAKFVSTVVELETRGWERGRGAGVLPEKSGWGLRPASRNTYPIYDQNLRYSLPFYDLTKNSKPYL